MVEQKARRVVARTRRGEQCCLASAFFFFFFQGHTSIVSHNKDAKDEEETTVGDGVRPQQLMNTKIIIPIHAVIKRDGGFIYLFVPIGQGYPSLSGEWRCATV